MRVMAEHVARAHDGASVAKFRYISPITVPKKNGMAVMILVAATVAEERSIRDPPSSFSKK